MMWLRILLIFLVFTAPAFSFKKPDLIFNQRQEGNWSLGFLLGGGITLSQTAIYIDGQRASLYPDNTYETGHAPAFNAGFTAQYFWLEDLSLPFRLYYDYRELAFQFKEPSSKIEKKGVFGFSFFTLDSGIRPYWNWFFAGAGFSLSLPVKGSGTGEEKGAFPTSYYRFSVPDAFLGFLWGFFVEAGLDFRFGKRSSLTLAARYRFYPPFTYEDSSAMNTVNLDDDTRLKAARLHPLTLNAELNFYF